MDTDAVWRRVMAMTRTIELTSQCTERQRLLDELDVNTLMRESMSDVWVTYRACLRRRLPEVTGARPDRPLMLHAFDLLNEHVLQLAEGLVTWEPYVLVNLHRPEQFVQECLDEVRRYRWQ